MVQHWPHVLRLLNAAQARTVVEIGAARGATTRNLVEWARERSAEIHVVDPAPRFDTELMSLRDNGGFTLHRATSHKVVPDLPPLDAVLIDGDHNWFTVYHELSLLDEKARREERPLPLVMMHDVRWPYGRRDQYYEPSRIPAEFRQEWSTGGMVKGRDELVKGHGFNAGVKHAVREGGPRNGVLTGVEDFMKASSRRLRYEEIVGFNGLGVVADLESVEATTALAEALDHLHSPEFLAAQCRQLDEGFCKLLVKASNERRRAILQNRRREELEAIVEEQRAMIAALESRLHPDWADRT